MTGRTAFRADLRELRFALWEQLDLEGRLAGLEGHGEFTRDVVDAVLDSALRFAGERLGRAYQQADAEGCALAGDGRVRVPRVYEPLWRELVDQGWVGLGVPRAHGGLGAPYVVCQAVNELLMGAEPSFMTYSGFAPATIGLVDRFGSEAQRQVFCPPLASGAWSACLCMTEADAGSDLAPIRTRATREEEGVYRLEGEKLFVSAAGHALAENIVYVVLARAEGAPAGVRGLSVFLVPQRRLDPDGAPAEDNHVRCVRLEEKMGLHGSSTAQVVFNAGGTTVGHLLGPYENRGLLQLHSMMAQARIATGVYALGMASSAYLHAVDYAHQRTQGARAGRGLDPLAERVAIIEHADVRRMLLEMKCRVEGCRALILRLAWYHTVVEALGAAPDEAQRAEARRCRRLEGLLTPVVKAYVSDQAWRVCGLAIQVHGGAGYTREHPVEQYARDVKVMSIWEGTNFIQAMDLVHRQLAVGRRSPGFEVLLEEMRPALDAARDHPDLHREATAVDAALDALRSGLERLGESARALRLDEVETHATRVLEALAEVVLGWLLVDAARIALARVDAGGLGSEDADFYAGKVAAARYFVGNLLPGVAMKMNLVGTAEATVCAVSPRMFRPA